MPNEAITVRQATAEDIPDLVRLRRLMFESMGYGDPARLDTADRAAATYFRQTIPKGEFHGWLAVTPTGEAVGSGGAVIDQHPPGPNCLSGRIGYVMNVVTVPAYRRQGIARRVMSAILHWLAEQDVQLVTLHATEMGRPLYRELGFETSTEMRLRLEQVPCTRSDSHRRPTFRVGNARRTVRGTCSSHEPRTSRCPPGPDPAP